MFLHLGLIFSVLGDNHHLMTAITEPEIAHLSPVEYLRREIRELADSFCAAHAIKYSTASKWALRDPVFLGNFLEGGNGTTQKLDRLSRFLTHCPSDPDGRHEFIKNWNATELLRD